MCGNADGVSKLQKYFPSTNLSEGSRILQTKIFQNHFVEVLSKTISQFFLMLRLSKTSKNYPIKYLTTFEAIYFVLGLQKVLPNTNHNLYQKPITVEIKEELSHSKTAGT